MGICVNQEGLSIKVHLQKMENNVSCLLGEIGVLFTGLPLAVLTNAIDIKRKLTKQEPKHLFINHCMNMQVSFCKALADRKV